MLKKLLPILCLTLLLFHPSHSQAQTDDPAALLVIESKADFWSWSAATGITRLTDTGYNFSVDRSPDGRYLVYTAYADFAAEALEAGNYYPAEIFPTDLLQYDLQTGTQTKLVSQPPDAVYNRDEVIGYDRFNPCWSPDGKHIAWIQLPLGMPDERGWQLVIYDVATGVAEVVTEGLPGPYGDAGMVGSIDLQWTSVGLITATFGGTDDNFFGQAFRIYNASGTLLAEQYLTVAQDLYPWFWSEDEAALIGHGTEYESSQTGYFRADPFAATQAFLPDQLVVTVARNAPDQLAYSIVDDDTEQPLHWWMQTDDAPTVDDVTGGRYFSRRVALDPAGQRLAYITDALYIWEDGVARRIPDTEQFGIGQSFSTLIWGESLGVIMRQDELPFAVE